VDLRRRVDLDAAVEHRPEWLEPELEGRRDPVVPAGTSDAPEEFGLLRLAGADDLALGRHELDGEQVVDGEPEPALQPADTAAERQAGHARVADDPCRADEAVCLGRDIELAEKCAAVRPCGAVLRVDRDAAHRREVDDQAAIGAGVAGRAVTARPDGELEGMVACEADRLRDFGRRRRADDARRMKVVDGVPQPSRLVVSAIAGRDDVAAELPAQLSDLTHGQRSLRLDHRPLPSPTRRAGACASRRPGCG
jgi:hypothetical protein